MLRGRFTFQSTSFAPARLMPCESTIIVVDALTRKAEESPASGPLEMPVPLKISPAIASRSFPAASTRPQLPPVLSEEILDYYGWVFCQGGFANLGMTFEEFLAVAAKLGGGLISL